MRPQTHPNLQAQSTGVSGVQAQMTQMNAGFGGGQEPATKTSKIWLWLLLLLLAGGGAAAVVVLTGGEPDAGGGGKQETSASEATTKPPPETPKETAELIISVDPKSAKLRVGGTPVEGRATGLELGSCVTVGAEAPGYVSFAELVKLDEKSKPLTIKLEKEREKQSLVIDTEGDPQAEIRVNGTKIGVGQQMYNGFKGDKITIEIIPTKGPPIKEELLLDGSTPVKRFQLGKQEAKLILNLDPVGAVVVSSKGTVAMSAKGNQAVVSGLEVNDTITVTVSKADYTEKKDTVALTSTSQELTIKLVKKAKVETPTPTPTPTPRPNPNPTPTPTPTPSGQGTIVITAKPWANVSVDGRPVGMTPRTVPVPAGRHTIVLTKGAQVVTRTVTVVGGKSASVFQDFTN
jgi:hypothetical protein